MRAGAVSVEGVSESCARTDGALCYVRNAVHVGCPNLVVPVPVQWRWLAHQIIMHVDHNFII